MIGTPATVRCATLADVDALTRLSAPSARELGRADDEPAQIERALRRLEMMATLPGMRLYAAPGYLPGERVDWPAGPGLTIPFVRMSKEWAP